MVPAITEIETGRQWTIGPCDTYRYVDGAIIMETRIPVGTVRTETYGLWDKPVFVRRIRFIPNEKATGTYSVSTTMSLFRDYSNKKPDDDPQWLAGYQIVAPDLREWPPSYSFPRRETLKLSDDRKIAWHYDDDRYRDVMVTVAEPDAQLGIRNLAAGKKEATYNGKEAGGVWFRQEGKSGEVSLTVVLAFDKDAKRISTLLNECTASALELKVTQKTWQDWFEKGAVVHTGDTTMDNAYRNQLMIAKAVIDAEFGGQIASGRYQMGIWTRDTGVCMSVLLEAGHYDEVKQMLLFLATHAAWNERNRCFNANMHSSGRVLKSLCAPGQRPVEEITQPGEWTNQMNGPQLDSLAYYLYDVAKYYRLTGDKDFIKSQWPFIKKVGDSLADDDYRFYENPIFSKTQVPSGFYGADGRFKKYNPETGLIVDNCWESGVLAEYSLMNALSIVGLRDAGDLSVAMNDEHPAWKQRAAGLEAAFNKYLVRDIPGTGYKILKNYPRQWIKDWSGKPTEGKEEFLGNQGYAWTIAATVPYFNYRNEVFKKAFVNEVDPKGEAQGWGMWWATTAQAAFEADRADIGWNYLSKYVAQLPPSLQGYENNQLVTDVNGVTQKVTYDIWSMAYLPHCMIRAFLGLGYDELSKQYFFRPQVPAEIGDASGRVCIGRTWFEVHAKGSGRKLMEFNIDGQKQPLDGILDAKYLDGGSHKVTLGMENQTSAADQFAASVPVVDSSVTGKFEAESAKLLGGAKICSDPAASGGAVVGWLRATGDGIACRSALLTGQRLTVCYAAETAATLILQVNDNSEEISFPATGGWGTYKELTVPMVIRENAVVQLRRGPGDSAVNLDWLKGEK